jgi:hypothetical protein
VDLVYGDVSGVGGDLMVSHRHVVPLCSTYETGSEEGEITRLSGLIKRWTEGSTYV